MRLFYCLYLIIFSLSAVFAQAVVLEADGPGDTYELISNVFGGTSYEVPDCGHNDFGRHIEEVWSDELQSYIFVFHIHTDEDNDRCTNFDRQRNEIKTYDQSPDNLLATAGETHIYRWKFKVDSAFQASPNFSHMFQIKPRGGPDDSMPILTITMRDGNPDQLQLRHAASNMNASTVAFANLETLKGQWLEVYCRYLSHNAGKLEFVIETLAGDTVLAYQDYDLDMWRLNANFNRPKWGIYRSLLNASFLRDEQVYFADFSIEEPEASTAPNPPSGLSAFSVNANQIRVTWQDESTDETNFRIQRSPDGVSWEDHGVTDANETTFNDPFLPTGVTYYYQVRAENWDAASGFSNIDSATTGVTTSIGDSPTTVPEKIELLQNYPNPFNPATTIAFQIPKAGHVQLQVFDAAGQLAETLINEVKPQGQYTIVWHATNLASGIYYYRLVNAGKIHTRKMLLVK